MKINLQRMILILTDLLEDLDYKCSNTEPLDQLYDQLYTTRKCCMDLVDTLEELEFDGENES
jgi:hypothetical protein